MLAVYVHVPRLSTRRPFGRPAVGATAICQEERYRDKTSCEHRFLRSFGYQDEPTATRSLVLPSSLRRSTPRLAHNPDGQPGGRCALRRWDASSLPGVEQKASIGTWHIAAKPRGKSVFFTSPNLRPCKFDLASTQPFPGRQPQD
ncbi:hypothetical protein LI328DRAFT_162812 [Trichoderma asperelloides]|nr:hypothetical protein LI328DRAFT_162812 [Trichoderma asperelloides]